MTGTFPNTVLGTQVAEGCSLGIEVLGGVALGGRGRIWGLEGFKALGGVQAVGGLRSKAYTT